MVVLTHEDLVFGQRAARLPAQSDERFGRTQNRDRLSAIGNQRQRSRLSGSPDQFARGFLKLFDGQDFAHSDTVSQIARSSSFPMETWASGSFQSPPL